MPETPETLAPSREALFLMATAMAAASGDVLRLVRNEADFTTKADARAGTFLKLNGRRLGRDLEVYAYMAGMRDSWAPVLSDLASEIVMQLRGRAPDAYGVGAATLVSMGRAALPKESQEEWANLLPKLDRPANSAAEVPMPNWHDENPYADRLVYVPIEELAALLSGGTITIHDGANVPITAESLLSDWARNGNVLDAYLLNGGTSAGIRFGSAPEAYLSPHVRDREAGAALLERYRDAESTRAPAGP